MVEVRTAQKMRAVFNQMETDRSGWEGVWRDLNKNYLPRSYIYLATSKEQQSPQKARNTHLLDSASIRAMNVLSNGLMDGITSPSRSWFRLRPGSFTQDKDIPYDLAVWLEDTRETLMAVFAASNFYPSMRKFYREFATFGTSSMGQFEDPELLVSYRNFALGEFYLQGDEDGNIIRHGRKFTMTAEELVRRFGEENVGASVRMQAESVNASRFTNHTVFVMTEPNADDEFRRRRSAKWRSIYWLDSGKDQMQVLRNTQLDEDPNLTARWETYARDVYGTAPSWDGLPDVVSRQHLIRRRGQALDRSSNPPMLISKGQVENVKALMAGGWSMVKGSDMDKAARPAYLINPHFAEYSQMLQENESGIQMVLFNDVFQAIARLDTVRSATEIEALKAERLVMLAPMLEQFERETLSPAIQFAYKRARAVGLVEAPPEIEEADLQITYVGILAEAQRAVAVASIERYLQVLGNMSAVFPEDVLDVPNAEAILRDYAQQISLRPDLNRSPAETAERRQAREEQRQAQEAAVQGQQLVQGAQQLSATDLGGGQNALQAMLG